MRFGAGKMSLILFLTHFLFSVMMLGASKKIIRAWPLFPIANVSIIFFRNKS
jgi:hypothetical protein